MVWIKLIIRVRIPPATVQSARTDGKESPLSPKLPECQISAERWCGIVANAKHVLMVVCERGGVFEGWGVRGARGCVRGCVR